MRCPRLAFDSCAELDETSASKAKKTIDDEQNLFMTASHQIVVRVLAAESAELAPSPTTAVMPVAMRNCFILISNVCSHARTRVIGWPRRGGAHDAAKR